MEAKYEIDAKFGAKWVAALRSGKYKQGQDYLCNGDKYCCLGVACAITMPNANLNGAVFISNKPDECFDSVSKTLYNKMPKVIRDDSELSKKLAGMNDNAESFDEIADWIELNVKFI